MTPAIKRALLTIAGFAFVTLAAFIPEPYQVFIGPLGGVLAGWGLLRRPGDSTPSDFALSVDRVVVPEPEWPPGRRQP